MKGNFLFSQALWTMKKNAPHSPLLLALAGIALVGFSCSKSDEETAYQYPPVGILKTTNYEVTLHTGPDGPLYTLRSSDGTELAREVDRSHLAAEFPEVNEELSGLWAGNESGKRPEAATILPDRPMATELGKR